MFEKHKGKTYVIKSQTPTNTKILKFWSMSSTLHLIESGKLKPTMSVPSDAGL